MSSGVDASALDDYYGQFTSEREKEVLGVPLRLVAAWAGNDVDAVVNVFTKDGTLILPGGVYKVGRDEIRAFLSAAFAGPFEGSRITGKPVDLRFVNKYVALIRTHGGILAPGETEISAERAVRSTWTLVKEDDGIWYLAGYQNSPRGSDATLRW
ncbi:SgcJ/EcaC family oxidoreductase [Amycolatopsis sp. lyj-112]|uniref:SgcJ/EcaC family oxidoreductase n=1 Tax=Amycolatopsis sp. lyj-112 TaxID=2789288 RepID=UPI00397BFD5F